MVVFHCFFTGLGRVGLLGPDEPRYGSIAREMARTGDWVTPRLNGSPWFEKPPLYYWAGAIGFRVFSTPEDAARVPSGIFALCAVAGVVLVALRFYGRGVAVAAAFMLPATIAMTGFARAAATDMPFAACLTLTMAGAAFLLLETQPAKARWVAGAFGAGLGLAMLAKGPAAILLTGGSAALWAVTTGNFRRVWRLFHPVAVLVFAAVALPWYVVCAARNPQFLRIFLLEHNVERFLTNRYQHQQPVWFFLPVILLAVFPWTLLLIPAIRDGWQALHTAEWRKSPGVFLTAWAVFPFAFFSASQSKLPGYILPAVPPLILLLARAVNGAPQAGGPARPWRALWVSLTLVPLGLAPLALRSSPNLSRSARVLLGLPGVMDPLRLVGIALLACALIVAGSLWLRRPAVSAGIAALGFSFAVGIAANHVLPHLDAAISPRQLALAAQREAGGAPIVVYELPRAWQYGAEFYLEEPLPEWNAGNHVPVFALSTPARCTELAKSGAGPALHPFFGPATGCRVP